MCSGVNQKSAIGSCIFRSTLVESLCQLGMCQSGVMHTVMSGEHCNSCELLEKKICCSNLERNLVRLDLRNTEQVLRLLSLGSNIVAYLILQQISRYLINISNVDWRLQCRQNLLSHCSGYYKRHLCVLRP